MGSKCLHLEAQMASSIHTRRSEGQGLPESVMLIGLSFSFFSKLVRRAIICDIATVPLWAWLQS